METLIGRKEGRVVRPSKRVQQLPGENHGDHLGNLRLLTCELQICARRTTYLAERQLAEFSRSFWCTWQHLIIPCGIRNSHPMPLDHAMDTAGSHAVRLPIFLQRANIRERIFGRQSSRFDVVVQNRNELRAKRALLEVCEKPIHFLVRKICSGQALIWRGFRSLSHDRSRLLPNADTPQIIEKMKGDTVYLAHDCADDRSLRVASIAWAPGRVNGLLCENRMASEQETTSSRTLTDPIVVRLLYEVQKSRKALVIPFHHGPPIN